MKGYLIILVVVAFTACTTSETANENKDSVNEKFHQQHDTHSLQVNERGDKAMGFSHQKTTHRFRLWTDGGAIEVTAKEAGDVESLNQIQKHLGHIAQMFGEGNFSTPMLTHRKTPPGVPVMQKLKGEIRFEFEKGERGGRVRINTSNPEALAAIHEFLRFQIEDHQTGDSTEIESGR